MKCTDRKLCIIFLNCVKYDFCRWQKIVFFPTNFICVESNVQTFFGIIEIHSTLWFWGCQMIKMWMNGNVNNNKKKALHHSENHGYTAILCVVVWSSCWIQTNCTNNLIRWNTTKSLKCHSCCPCDREFL